MGILDTLILGNKIEAHGKEWCVIQHIATSNLGTVYLATEMGAELPSVVHMIVVPSKSTKNSP